MAENPTAPGGASTAAAIVSQKPRVIPAPPLSPFMLGPYYRFQLTSVLSFVHRLTGLALSMGTLVIAAWVMSAAMGPYAYASFSAFAGSIFGKILLLGWTWALLYHLCNGVRHLVWDSGHAFELKHVYLGGYLVVAASLVLTAAVWAAAFIF
jgi:succinate dehydrogenase / fumarate reductase cytochrome b subunit